MVRKRKRGVNGQPWVRADIGVWYVKVDGRKVSLRDKYGNLIRGAEHEAEARAAWHKMMSVAAAPVNQDDNELVVILDLYLQWIEQTATDKTLGEYLKLFKSFVKEYPQLRVRELQPRHLRDWWEASFPNWSDSTRNHSATAFTAALNWARSADGGRIITFNPLEGMTKPSMGRRGHEVLISDDDHSRLLETVPSDLRLMLIALRHTGTRPSNLWRATPLNFDEERGILLMGSRTAFARHYDPKNPQHKTQKKTGRVLIVPLTATVVKMCVSLREELRANFPEDYQDRPLFRTKKGEPWNATKLASRLLWYKKRLNLDHVICYGYRHTVCTDLVEANVSAIQAAAVVGQDNPDTIARNYEHARSGSLIATLAALRPPTEAETKLVEELAKGIAK